MFLTSKKTICFFQVSLFPKKVAFFSRAWSLEISRGRLARQAPAFGWGAQRGTHSTRDALNAGHSQRGMQLMWGAVNGGRCQRRRQLTQMAVKGGGHYRKQPSLNEADKNILFHTPTMTDIRRGLVIDGLS